MEGVDNRPIAMDKVAVEEIYIHGIIIIIIILLLLCIAAKEVLNWKLLPPTTASLLTYIFAFIPIQQPQRPTSLGETPCRRFYADFTIYHRI